MEMCLEILKLPKDALNDAFKKASTVEIISKIQHLEMLITSSFKEGRPLYHPMQIGSEVTQSMCELQIALIEELKRRQATKPPGFEAEAVCAALKPLVVTTAATMVVAIVGKCGEKYHKPGKPWCVFKHDSKDHSKRAATQPKGWPKHYATEEEAKKAIKMMHTFGAKDPWDDPDKLFGTVHKDKFWYVQDEQGRKFEIKELDDAGNYLSKHVLFHINENDEAVDLEPA